MKRKGSRDGHLFIDPRTHGSLSHNRAGNCGRPDRASHIGELRDRTRLEKEDH